MSLTYLIQDLRSIAGSERASRVLKSVVFDHTAHLTIMLRLGQSLLKIPVIGRVLSFLVEYLFALSLVAISLAGHKLAQVSASCTVMT